MNLIRHLKKLNFSNFVNFYFEEFKKLLLRQYFIKKKAILRNSYKVNIFSRNLIHDFNNIDEIREEFFHKKIFAYANQEGEKNRIIEYLDMYCSSEVKQYLEIANKVLEKKFQIFEKHINFDKNISWHYSFFQDFYWKLEKSESINLYPENQEVDVKYTWEFNRHQFLPYLGFAFYYTKDDIYAEEFKKIILDWIRKNPPLYGINWYSGLEISIRLTSWIFSLFFFKDSVLINNSNFFKKILLSMYQHAYYLRYFYTRRKFNHTVGDLFGLYFFLKIFENIKPLQYWKKKIFTKFRKQIFLQTRPDGTSLEQSINYHRFILEFFILFLILNPNNLNPEEIERIEKMFEFLLYIIKPNKKFPKIGDFDDGRVLLLTHHSENPFLDLLNIGSVFFGNDKLKFISNKISPLLILLFGTKGINKFNEIPATQPRKNFKYFKNAGYFIIRNNWSLDANYLFMDFGRFGAHNAGHSHSSITNFILSYNGKDMVIDSGTFSYNKSLNERNYFRSSEAHNILTINKNNQAIIKSRFEWENKPKIKRIIKIDNNRIEATCYHNGYKNFILKRVILLRPDLESLTIIDTVFQIQKSSKNKIIDIDINYHFNNDIEIYKNNNSFIVDKSLRWKISSKQYFKSNLKVSYFSPSYGKKYKSNNLNIHLKNNFNLNNIIKVKTEILAVK